jgi:hypothetical protein
MRLRKLLLLSNIYIQIKSIDLLLNKLSLTKGNSIFSMFIRSEHVFKTVHFNLKDLRVEENLLSNPFDYSLDNLVVIVAGPLIKHLDFTYVNLDRFRKIFPFQRIIYSTDSVINKKLIERFKEIDIEVIQNNLIPPDPDERLKNLRSQVSNVNKALQSITDENSLVLRVRSDQLFIKENFIYNLIAYNNAYNKDKSKIIKLSMNSYINRDFSTSDMFMFGPVCLLREYWNINESNIIQSVDQLEKYSNLVFPESILDSCFFNKSFGFYPTTRKDYFKLLKNNYLIIDESNINVLWFKDIFIKSETSYQDSRKLVEITHADWLAIQANDAI